MIRASLKSFPTRRVFRPDALFFLLSLATYGTLPAAPQTTPHPSQSSFEKVPGTNFPKLMHVCGGGCDRGNGDTFVWQSGRYVNASNPSDKATYTIEKFAKDSVVIEKWRVLYNTKRPHSALGYRPPAPAACSPWGANPSSQPRAVI